MPVIIEKGKLISRGLQNRNSRFDSSVPRISVGGLNKPKAAPLAELWHSTTSLLTSRQASLSIAKRRRHSSKTLAIALILAVWLLATATTVHASRKSSCANSPERAVRACIWHAAKKYKQHYPTALRVAKCESGLDPYSSGTYDGLYQFLPSTWQTTKYRNRDVHSAKYNSLAAMYMWANGRAGEWGTCL